MKLGKKLSEVWHDIYYHFAGNRGVDFAMKCKDVAHQIDLPEKGKSIKERFRFLLHLTMCEACRNYYSFSKFLRLKVRELLGKNSVAQDIDNTSRKLMAALNKDNKGDSQ